MLIDSYFTKAFLHHLRPVCEIYCSFQSLSARESLCWPLVLPRIVAVFIIVSLYELRSMAKEMLLWMYYSHKSVLTGGMCNCVLVCVRACVWVCLCVCVIPLANKLQQIPKDQGFPKIIMASSALSTNHRSSGFQIIVFDDCLLGSLGKFTPFGEWKTGKLKKKKIHP